MIFMRKINIFTFVFLALTTVAQASPREQIMLVFDASGSMWGKIEGRPKISVAKDALRSIVKDLSQDKDLGLLVYGHRRKDDCSDIELLAPVGTLDSHEVDLAIEKIKPKGKTPISNSVRKAAEELKYTENKATVVLISDGIETCNADPCELAIELESLGVDFTAHVIGLDIKTEEDQAKLKCLADNTGGKFLLASSASELNKALEETVKATPIAEPKKMSLQSPEQAIKGTEVKVIVDGEVGAKAYLHIYESHGDKSLNHSSLRENKIGGYDPVLIRVPANVGPYVFKLIDTKNNVLAELPIEVKDADIQMNYFKEAVKGTELAIDIKAPLGLDGYIYLHKKGVSESIAYATVRQSVGREVYETVKIRLPVQKGDYELKWLNSKKEKLAEGELAIVDAQIGFTHKPEAIKGTELKVEINAPLGLSGYVYLYKGDSKKSITYGRVHEDASGAYQIIRIRLPNATGDFKLKWLSNSKELLSESDLKILDAEIKISAPTEAIKGTAIAVNLEAPLGLTGYIHLYKEGGSKSLTYGSIREGSLVNYEPVEIRLPAVAGDYVLKWQDTKNDLLAETKIKATDAEIVMETASEAQQATSLDVILKAPPGLDGYVYLYREGQDKYLSYERVVSDPLNDYRPIVMKMPVAIGNYILKWQSSGNQVLSEKKVSVVKAEVTMEAPEKVKVGEGFEVKLTGPTGISGYVYAFKKGALKSIIYSRVNSDNFENYKPSEFKGIEEAGTYILKWMPNDSEVLVERELEVVE